MKRNHLILGTGNVAWHLAQALKHAETAIWGRNTAEAQRMAEEAGIEWLSSLDGQDQAHTTIYYALNDDSVAALSRQLQIKNATEVHLSGSLPINALSASKRMVMWPVCSLVKGTTIDLQHIPWVVQGEWKDHLPPFSMVEVNDDQTRAKYHLSAVVLNNFVHHLGVLTKDMLGDVPRDLFKVLLEQTIDNMFSNSELDNQTGPARRGDASTIQRHIQMLENHPVLRDVYQQFSQQIAQRYDHEL